MAEDDGRPTMAEALEALRGDAVTEPAPDLSLPGSLQDVLKAFTPAGTDPDELMESLKASRMPSVPLSQIRDMRWCRTCQRPEPADMLCPAACAEHPDTKCAVCSRPFGEGEHHCMGIVGGAALSEPSLPADPFTPGRQAGIAAMDMYDDLLAAGMPLASVERVLGAMFASLIAQTEGNAGG